jgi:hypothetical protein
MKQLITLTVILFSLFGVAKADEDRPIQVNELPKKAQELIQQHFSKQSISYAKVEQDFWDKNYDVIFVNGNKIEFDKNGKWEKVDCKYTEVPSAIIPKQILEYLKKEYPQAKVLQIERNSRGYEVELNNKLEIKFNHQFKVVEIDR